MHKRVWEVLQPTRTPKDQKQGLRQDTCALTFTEALFPVAIGEATQITISGWMENTMWSTRTVEYYSAMIKNEALT